MTRSKFSTLWQWTLREMIAYAYEFIYFSFLLLPLEQFFLHQFSVALSSPWLYRMRPNLTLLEALFSYGNSSVLHRLFVGRATLV